MIGLLKVSFKIQDYQYKVPKILSVIIEGSDKIIFYLLHAILVSPISISHFSQIFFTFKLAQIPQCLEDFS
jgi:hypothetical protein